MPDIQPCADPFVVGIARILNRNCMDGGGAALNELRTRFLPRDTLTLEVIAKVIERAVQLDINGAVVNAEDVAEEIIDIITQAANHQHQ